MPDFTLASATFDAGTIADMATDHFAFTWVLPSVLTGSTSAIAILENGPNQRVTADGSMTVFANEAIDLREINATVTVGAQGTVSNINTDHFAEVRFVAAKGALNNAGVISGGLWGADGRVGQHRQFRAHFGHRA